MFFVQMHWSQSCDAASHLREDQRHRWALSMYAAPSTSFSQKVHIKSLTIGQRDGVLQRGLGDRSEAVQYIVKKEMIPVQTPSGRWVKLSGHNIVQLLHHLDVGNSDQDVGPKKVGDWIYFSKFQLKKLIFLGSAGLRGLPWGSIRRCCSPWTSDKFSVFERGKNCLFK